VLKIAIPANFSGSFAHKTPEFILSDILQKKICDVSELKW